MEEKYELISVIVPVFNVEKYLDECIVSIVNQTYHELDIILIDDGSTDLSGIICDNWQKKDKRIRVIHKSNEGLSSARNTGISIAHGSYIGFVDSDDRIDHEMYSSLYKLINSGNYDMAMCGINRSDSTHRVENDCCFVYDRKQFIKSLLKIGTQKSYQYAWNKLYRRNLLDCEIYPVGLTDEDVLGTFRIGLRCNSIIETTRRYYFYRVDNSTSISSPIFNYHRVDFLKICDYIVDIANYTNDVEIIEWAELFRKRADFSVLARIAVMRVPDYMRSEVTILVKDLLARLRSNYLFLIKSDIPISRKILITSFCINYKISAFFLKNRGIKVK